MKILTLIIQQVYFNEILAGTKKEEYREVKPTTSGKYIQYVDNVGKVYKPSKLPDDIDADIEILKYDAIRFCVGYHKNRASVLVEVKDAELEVYEKDTYTYKGKEYCYALMTYSLGKVIEVHSR